MLFCIIFISYQSWLPFCLRKILRSIVMEATFCVGEVSAFSLWIRLLLSDAEIN